MNKRETRRPFTHLNQYERDRIEALKKAGHTQKEMAEILKVDPSTISREIQKRKRKNGVYDADTAQHKAQVKRSLAKHRGRKIEQNRELRVYIIEQLKQYRSPDEIAGRMKRENQPFYAGKDAIYDWLYSVYGQQWCRHLCTKRYRPRKQKHTGKREMIPNATPIHERPEHGIHAEGDTFVSPRKANTTASGAVVVEKESKLMVGQRIPNLRPATMTHAVRTSTAVLRTDTLTLDRGIENKYHEQLGVATYFCDPHSPWQKPLVEQAIGLLRRWFIPKGTDLRTVSDEQLQDYLVVLNHKWRKSLGYKSAYEVAIERGIIAAIPMSMYKKTTPRVAFGGRI